MVPARHVGVFLESGRADKFNGPGSDIFGRFHEFVRSGSWKIGVDRLKNFIAVFDRSRHDLSNKGSEGGSRAPTSAVSQIRILEKGVDRLKNLLRFSKLNAVST